MLVLIAIERTHGVAADEDDTDGVVGLGVIFQ